MCPVPVCIFPFWLNQHAAVSIVNVVVVVVFIKRTLQKKPTALKIKNTHPKYVVFKIRTF